MSVIPSALRSVEPSSPLGDLTFTPSVDAVLYYEARVYAEGTSSPVLTSRYLGKPEADIVTNKIKVNLKTMLNALTPGNYEVTVAAIGSGGTSESSDSNVFIVPLSLP